MKITRRSQVSGIERTINLNITEEQIKAHRDGANVQDCMPHLTPDEREFYITGLTKEEWDEMYGPRKLEIKNDQQLATAKENIEKFQKAIEEHDASERPEQIHEKIWHANRAAMVYMVEELVFEVGEYEAFKKINEL